MGKIVSFPERPQVEQCEGGCGPATHHDDEGIPLCKACYESLEPETLSQRRAREMGIDVIDGGAIPTPAATEGESG